MNNLEEARARVARAQEERDRLYAGIVHGYGTLHELDVYCRSRAEGAADAKDARKQYNAAVKELKLAKQDLEFVEATFDVAPERQDPGPEEQTGEVEVSISGEPATQETLAEHIADRIEEAEQENEKRRTARQVDLHGDELKLPLGVKETKKISRSRVYEIENYKLTVKEDDLLQFHSWPSYRKRTFVAVKLRFVPSDEATTYDDMDFDGAVSDMVGILSKASFILRVEKEREALLMRQLAEMI